MKTQKEIFEAALAKRGERLVKRNFKNDVWSRAKGGFYYLGKAGSLRYGPTRQASVPVNEAFKEKLKAELGEGS